MAAGLHVQLVPLEMDVEDDGGIITVYVALFCFKICNGILSLLYTSHFYVCYNDVSLSDMSIVYLIELKIHQNHKRLLRFTQKPE